MKKFIFLIVMAFTIPQTNLFADHYEEKPELSYQNEAAAFEDVYHSIDQPNDRRSVVVSDTKSKLEELQQRKLEMEKQQAEFLRMQAEMEKQQAEMAKQEEELRKLEELAKKEEEKNAQQPDAFANPFTDMMDGYPKVKYPTAMIGQFMNFCVSIMVQRMNYEGVPQQMSIPASGFTCSCIMDNYRLNNDQAEFQFEFTRKTAKEVPLFSSYLQKCTDLSAKSNLFNSPPQKTSTK